jgi:hypothetical protein
VNSNSTFRAKLQARELRAVKTKASHEQTQFLSACSVSLNYCAMISGINHRNHNCRPDQGWQQLVAQASWTDPGIRLSEKGMGKWCRKIWIPFRLSMVESRFDKIVPDWALWW